MTEVFVPRTLSFLHGRETISIDARAALSDERLAGKPLILLGEAGSGKSELLRQWSAGPVATARQIVNGWKPGPGRCFVDGLDEAAGLHGGDALDRLLSALEAQQRADFVIACRVADWRSASGRATITEWTGVDPVELTLEPFGQDEAVAFLQLRNGFKPHDAHDFATHYGELELGDWLGNPQTLHMLAASGPGQSRPETIGELFNLYVERSWKEPRQQGTPLAKASEQVVLNALGALFAALIVGGYDALTLAPGAKQRENDLPLAECRDLPGVQALDHDHLSSFLGSRLVAPAGQDRYTYQHRRIGEYLGARWLASHAQTHALQKRLLSALRHEGLVPSSLRGLWGWLAEAPKLAFEVIETDPLAVIEYGNADIFGLEAAKRLLDAIERFEDAHGQFGWRAYRAASLVQAELSGEVERILSVPGRARFWTQILLLRQMRTAEVVKRHLSTLRALILDRNRPYATRDAAADALADHGALNDWPMIIQSLVQGDDRESLRLALVMMRNPNVGLTLSDAEFAETVFAYAGLTPRLAGDRQVGTIGLYYHDPDEPIPDRRLDGMLDALADCARRFLSADSGVESWEVERLIYHLLRRRLQFGEVDVEKLEIWLNRFNLRRLRGAADERVWLERWFRENQSVRRELQRRTLDTLSDESGPLRWRLFEMSEGLVPSVEDVVALLNWLPQGDPRWRELIWLAPAREEGSSARAAAQRHIRSQEDQDILQRHADPQPQQWEVEQRNWQEKRERERKQERDATRSSYLEVRDQMRSGFWGALAGPAQVYMGRVYEANKELPAEARIGEWIGDDLQADALAGFEAFLTANPSNEPSAAQIAESHANSRIYNAALIVSAALAERQRTGKGFADVTTERIQAGLFAERAAFLDSGDWDSLRDALITELERRGAWAEAACLFIEPQLRRRADHVSWLWRVLGSDAGTELAIKWLREFPRVPAEPEQALIDHLLRQGGESGRRTLTDVARRRRPQRLDERRRRNWEAVELILGTRPPQRLTETAASDPFLLWSLRDRMGEGRWRDPSVKVRPGLLAAIIGGFVPHWPFAGCCQSNGNSSLAGALIPGTAFA